MRLRNGAYEENSQPVERTCVRVCCACVTCAYVCFEYAVVTILSLFLSRVNRVFTQFFVRKVYVNYITVQECSIIDEIARISNGGTI